MLLVYRRSVRWTFFLKHPVGNFTRGGEKVREKRGGKSKTQRLGGDRKTNVEIGQMYGKEREEEENAR